MKLYQLLLCYKSWEIPKFPDHLLYLKEVVDALPEQDNYIPYQEDDFMFIFSNDKHENMSFLSDLYGAECSRINSLDVCKQEKEQLHGILNIMTRSMSKAKQAEVPAIYPLKGEHKKPEHVKPDEVRNEIGEQGLPCANSANRANGNTSSRGIC